MKKSKKIIAMLVVGVMLICNMMLLLKNISVATQTNVTVEISADNDSSLTLSEDKETLTYTRDTERVYSFNLKSNGVNVKFEKLTDQVEGRYYDKYVAEGITSNENLYIVTPEMSFTDIQIMYNGNSIGMWNDRPEYNGNWFSQSLNQLTENSDVNHYQFRIEANHANDNINNNNNENNNNVDWTQVEYDVDFGTATWEIKGKTVTATIEGKDITSGSVKLTGAEKIKLTGYDPKIMEPALIRVTDDFSERLLVDENNETWVINRNQNSFPNDIAFRFVVQRRTGLDNQEDDWKDLSNTNATAIVNLSYDEQYGNSYEGAVIEINGYPINSEVDIGEPIPATNNAAYLYNESENNGKVKFTFSTLFIQKYVGKITINDETYDVTEDLLDYSNRTDWLNHYGHQMVTLEIDVDKADVYNIKLNVAENEGKDQWIGNFLWTDREEEQYVRDGQGRIVYQDGKPKVSDEYIGNSLLEVVKVVYEIDDQEITVEGDDLFRDRHIEYDPYREFASLVVPEGAKCTMKITPDYGYQVVSFGVNDNAIETGDAISEFTFPIHKGNFHLGAQVLKVEDVVNANSEKVKSGSIEISNNEIDSGSVVLSVNDIELGEQKMSEFEEAAGDYTINSYLDIDLDKVLYKGTSEDAWTERIHELNNEATITLQLEEGVDGNNIIIVHNINDGDEYEIIEIESYDPETNTITFKTSSFSNYAIAIKEDSTDDPTENPGEDPTENEPGNSNENEESNAKEKYTVSSGDFTVVFSDDEGHNFELSVVELMHLTDEQLEEFDLTREQYEQAKKEIIEALAKYGTIINVYDITVSDQEFSHFGELTIKIKMTEEMKKYNTFRLVCIDNEEINPTTDIAELKQDGDYLVGNLYHLSNYALVVDNVENNTSSNTSNSTGTTTTNNPTTGDNIATYITIFTISTLGIIIISRINKNNKKRKH